LDVSTFLNYVSLDNFTDYCLSYTFTARDFADGTLGLAWVAKLTGSVGGVCERRQPLQGIYKSLNSGIVTVVNYQARVPEAVSQITFAHEVGHNFGSEHDPDDSTCSPGANKGGNFIMYRRATAGVEINNRNFSKCSKDQMGPIMHKLVMDPTKFCFKPYNGSLCGNGIVEQGEECDCGYKGDCKETCCYDASEEPSKKCRLKPNSECSPSQGACCGMSCKFTNSSTVCMSSTECLFDVKCTGKDSYCPRNHTEFFKQKLSTCNSGTQVCKEGVCTGSICERHNMTQCYLRGNLENKNEDKAVLCHLACIGTATENECVDSFKIPQMMNAMNSGFILKPGSPCAGTLGYCDIFSKCRLVDGEGPLLRLKNFLLNPVTLSAIRIWVTVILIVDF
jgi:disintegrin and metalloproteinase domain-containing protein 10